LLYQLSYGTLSFDGCKDKTNFNFHKLFIKKC
jgi:hypothetical protein